MKRTMHTSRGTRTQIMYRPVNVRSDAPLYRDVFKDHASLERAVRVRLMRQLADKGVSPKVSEDDVHDFIAESVHRGFSNV